MLNFEKINEAIEEGLISRRKHPTQDLWILNYTQTVQIDRKWNQETISCRGLIVNDLNRVIARPFKKFFNIEELSYFRNYLHNLYDVKYSEIFRLPFKAYEKLDGSLGILYWDKKERLSIATRGSFESEQAVKATEILRTKYSDVKFERRYTYLFEIIYKENRIVLDYGDTEDIRLIAILDTDTGIDNDIYSDEFAHLPFIRPILYEGIYGLEELSHKQEENKEGFVLLFENGFRAKFKFEEYKRLHKIMTGVTPKRIFEQVRANVEIDKWLENVPDEFYQEIKKQALDFSSAYAKIEAEAKEIYEKVVKECESKPEFDGDIRHSVNRKLFASKVIKTKYASILFSILDRKSYDQLIWNIVETSI